MHRFSVMRTLPLIFLVYCLLLTLTGRQSAHAQRGYSKQFGFTTENDLYLVQGSDGYYTNGISLHYQQAKTPRSSRNRLVIHRYEAGQQIFTAKSRKIHKPHEIDRPIAGYIYAQYDRVSLNEKRVIQWAVRLGLVGKSALGEEMQNTVHRLIGINTDVWKWSWNYQLNNEPGADLKLACHTKIAEPTAGLRLVSESRASLGTQFSHLSQSLVLQAGKFNLMHQSAHWSGGLTADNKTPLPAELYFFCAPGLTWQRYDATVQGGMFREDKGPITDGIRPIVMSFETGAAFSSRSYVVRISVWMQGRQAQRQEHNHRWGSISAAYRFK